MANCNLCGKPAVVEIAGITREMNLCEDHITPPYDQNMVRSIFNDMRVDTVVSFLKNVHDRIQQDKKIAETDKQIQEIMNMTGINQLGQIERERNEAKIRVKELESKVQALTTEISILTQNTDETGEFQRLLEDLEETIQNSITDAKDSTSHLIMDVKDAIMLKLDNNSAGAGASRTAAATAASIASRKASGLKRQGARGRDEPEITRQEATKPGESMGGSDLVEETDQEPGEED